MYKNNLKKRINETKCWFFEKINKLIPLAILTRRRGKKTQVNKIEDEKGISQQIPKKSGLSLGNTLKIYTKTNWKM
jgi:hypothetical protein